MTSPAAAPEFSDAALLQLGEALRLYVSTWDEMRHDTLREALERLCAEAHAAQMGPERMLVAAKTAWARVPGIERVDVERAQMAWDRVVGYCIDAYYSDAR